jgi:hypothetical protein
MLTINDYHTALNAGSACNLSGVVHSFSGVLTRIWDEAREQGEGTNWVNQHPISRMYAYAINKLSYGDFGGDLDQYVNAYNACLDAIARLREDLEAA